MTEFERILSTEYSEKFDDLRKKAMVMGHYKYGSVKKNRDLKCTDMIGSIEKRIKKYMETGNTEFLVDIANFAMIEFMYPAHPNGHYEPTDSNQSPGLEGMSYKEVEEFLKNED